MAIGAKATGKDSPATTGQAHNRQKRPVTICRDVFAGTLTLRDAGSTYLPKFPQELDPAYESRRQQSVLFNAYGRTVKGLVGMVFRNDPAFGEDVPDDMKEHAEDIDLTGRSLPVFARDVFEEGMIDGHHFILVDWPSVEEGEALTLADERAQGLRPYWVSIRKQDVLNWRTRQEQGRTILTQVSIRFITIEADGQFADAEVERIRVYTVVDALGEDGEDGRYVKWAEWKKVTSEDSKKGTTAGTAVVGESWVIEREGRLTIPVIPLVAVYTNRIDVMESSPPLLDLSLENVKHWQVRSDADNVLHICSVPIPVFTGLEEGQKLSVGANVGIILPIDGKAAYLEPKGVALDAGRDQQQDIEQRMAALGLAMLQRQTRQAETAQAKMIDKAESDSALSAAARGLEDALNECLELHAMWMDIEDGGKISVNSDFMAQMMDPRMIEVLSKLVSANHLTLETMWALLVAGELLPTTFDAIAEMEGIETASDAQLAVLSLMAAQRPKPGEPEGGTGGTEEGNEEGTA